MAGIAGGIEIITEIKQNVVAQADIITNSGHVRPIDAETVSWMKPTAVVPLMYEAWEFRVGDVDLAACRHRGIAHAGTNEQHPAVDVFSFLGMMSAKLLMDAGFAVYGTTVLLLCDNPFGPFIERGLVGAGARVDTLERLSAAAGDRRYDAILVAMKPRLEPVLSATDAVAIASRWPTTIVAQFWGDVDRLAFSAADLSVWPLHAPQKGAMGVLPSALGPEPVVRLQAGGLKVGEILWELGLRVHFLPRLSKDACLRASGRRSLLARAKANSDMIDIVEFTPEYREDWTRFLQESNNGTLFHDLEFLAYHPEDRFITRHLLFRKDGSIVALLPAAIVSESNSKVLLKSAYGASIGDLVLPVAQPAETTMELVRALQEYVRSSGFTGIQLRLGPSVYMREPNESLSYALMANGFRLNRRWLCHVIALPTEAYDVLKQSKRGKARDYQIGIRNELKPREVGPEGIDTFYELLESTETRHGAVPTHRKKEIRQLFQLVPSRIRLFLCEKNGKDLAGVLLFVLNDRAAYTFYICQDYLHNEPYTTTVLVMSVAQSMASEGFRILTWDPAHLMILV